MQRPAELLDLPPEVLVNIAGHLSLPERQVGRAREQRSALAAWHCGAVQCAAARRLRRCQHRLGRWRSRPAQLHNATTWVQPTPMPDSRLKHPPQSCPFPPPACRLELGRVCKQLYQATRSQGARLWERLPVSFSSAGTLGSFAAWRGRCACAPHTLILQHVDWQQGMGEEEATWGDVVAAARQVLPTLHHLMIRFDGDGVAAEWLREAVQLQDLGLYCSTLSLGNALGSLPQVRRWLGRPGCQPEGPQRRPPGRPTAHTHARLAVHTHRAACLACAAFLPDWPAVQLLELNLESSEGPLNLESAASLPPSLSKIFAVESHMAEVPGGRAELAACFSSLLFLTD